LWLLSPAKLARSFIARLPTVAPRGEARLRPRSPRHAEQLDAFAAELMRARCRLHTDLAVCDQCVGPRQLDSLGFPSVTVAKGRGRYKLCPDCRKLCSIPEWHTVAVRLSSGLTAFRNCKGCAGAPPEP
jgi:hypothetical protein